LGYGILEGVNIAQWGGGSYSGRGKAFSFPSKTAIFEKCKFGRNRDVLKCDYYLCVPTTYDHDCLKRFQKKSSDFSFLAITFDSIKIFSPYLEER
tara:strand:- start:210 stop:494 length:285 start_codon:yes stop_codon:yes gene_type:complete